MVTTSLEFPTNLDTRLYTLVGLVNQYSPSGEEQTAVEWLVTRMKINGFSESFVDQAGNAVGFIGEGSQIIILLGHIDTVPGRIPVRLEPERLYGRGAVDAKGALAAFVDAVSGFETPPGWRVFVIGVVDEEGDSDGARAILEQYKPDYLIVGEPNRWDRIAIGYKGSAWTKITIKRPQTHTAHQGENLFDLLIKDWERIKGWVIEFNAAHDKEFRRIQVSIQDWSNGSDGFENWATMSVSARLPILVHPEKWLSVLNETLIDSIAEPIGFSCPAFEANKNTPLIRAFLHGVRSQAGTPAFVFKTGTADVNILAPAWGCPAIVYGPGDSSLDHTPDENLDLADFYKSIEVLKEALQFLVSQTKK